MFKYTYFNVNIYVYIQVHISTHPPPAINKTKEFLCDETQYYQLLTSNTGS